MIPASGLDVLRILVAIFSGSESGLTLDSGREFEEVWSEMGGAEVVEVEVAVADETTRRVPQRPRPLPG